MPQLPLPAREDEKEVRRPLEWNVALGECGGLKKPFEPNEAWWLPGESRGDMGLGSLIGVMLGVVVVCVREIGVLGFTVAGRTSSVFVWVVDSGGGVGTGTAFGVESAGVELWSVASADGGVTVSIGDLRTARGEDFARSMPARTVEVMEGVSVETVSGTGRVDGIGEAEIGVDETTVVGVLAGEGMGGVEKDLSGRGGVLVRERGDGGGAVDRKSTRLNSSHWE